MRKIQIKDREYKIATYDINMDCNLEEVGLGIGDLQRRARSFIRAYFAISNRIPLELAGKIMNDYFIENGNFDVITNAIVAEIEESDFFRKVLQTMATAKQKKAETESKNEEQSESDMTEVNTEV